MRTVYFGVPREIQLIKKQVLIILINLLTATQEVHVSNSVRYGNTSELLALSKMGCVITQPIFDNASNSEDKDQRLADGRTSDDGLYRDMHSVARYKVSVCGMNKIDLCKIHDFIVNKR